MLKSQGVCIEYGYKTYEKILAQDSRFGVFQLNSVNANKIVNE